MYYGLVKDIGILCFAGFNLMKNKNKELKKNSNYKQKRRYINEIKKSCPPDLFVPGLGKKIT